MKTMKPTKKTIKDYPVISGLVEKYFGDSRSESEKAEKELINICEPIIKRYCKAIEKYIEQIGGDFRLRDVYFDFDYSCSRGGIDNFVLYDEEARVLEFGYSDGCMGEIYECDVYMPFEWLDEDKFDDNMVTIKDEIKSRLIEYITNKITEQEKTLNCLKEHLEKLKNN